MDLEETIEGIITAIEECGRHEQVIIYADEKEILLHILKEALKAVRERNLGD